MNIPIGLKSPLRFKTENGVISALFYPSGIASDTRAEYPGRASGQNTQFQRDTGMWLLIQFYQLFKTFLSSQKAGLEVGTKYDYTESEDSIISDNLRCKM